MDRKNRQQWARSRELRWLDDGLQHDKKALATPALVATVVCAKKTLPREIGVPPICRTHTLDVLLSLLELGLNDQVTQYAKTMRR